LSFGKVGDTLSPEAEKKGGELLIGKQNMTNDISSLNIHLDGLMEIIRRRGGSSTLDTNQSLRMMLFWYILALAQPLLVTDRIPGWM
jgi:hypothetical protein